MKQIEYEEDPFEEGEWGKEAPTRRQQQKFNQHRRIEEDRETRLSNSKGKKRIKIPILELDEYDDDFYDWDSE